MSAEPVVDVVAELTAILAAIRGGDGDRAALMDRLYDLAPYLTGEARETTLIAKISGCKGWSGIVARMPRPAKPARPALRVVGEDEGRVAPDGLPEGWSDPGGWICARDGVWQIRETMDGGRAPVRVTQRPLWISRRWADVDTEAWTVEIRWPEGSAIVPREQAVSSREIVTLGGRGAPISSNSARGAVAWLEASEEQNRDAVPVLTSISRVGWTMAEGARAIQLHDGPHLLRAEDGHGQTARAMATSGDWRGWCETAAEVNRSPVAALMLAASVASVMLEASDAPPFVMDLHGLSSRGKTTALRWAASAWANPTDGAAYILPWSATVAAIEGRAGFLRHLPLMLDDTKKVSPADRPKIGAVVYGWGSGQGKARAHTSGVREVATWRSVLISTGEAPLVRLAGEHGGLRLRVLPIEDTPFPDNAPAVGLIETLADWGHAGPKVAAWTVQHWDSLRARWDRHREQAMAKIDGGPAATRVAQYIASVWLAVEALVAVGVPMPALAEMKDILLRAGRTAVLSSDLAAEAWDRVGGWLVSKQAQVKGAIYRPEPVIPPGGGWIGRVVAEGDVAVFTSALEEEMRRQGYDPEELVPQWSKRGLMRLQGGSPKVPTRFDGVNTRMYRLNLPDWKEATEPTRPEPPPPDDYRRW